MRQGVGRGWFNIAKAWVYCPYVETDGDFLVRSQRVARLTLASAAPLGHHPVGSQLVERIGELGAGRIDERKHEEDE